MEQVGSHNPGVSVQPLQSILLAHNHRTVNCPIVICAGPPVQEGHRALGAGPEEDH